ncbi:MAG: Ni/Fe-hydrogenase cytochrome b subunit [Planctomycetes bacterium]|nr:Ni/Fe-hydrogenase cytochrome b subunit [Planctomycetota bacterium]
MDSGLLLLQAGAAAVMAGLALVASALLAGRRTPGPGQAPAWGLLVAIWALGGWVLAERYARGLGAVTGLSDTFPWGIWKFNVLCGIACGAGGFTMAGTVYIFRAKPYYPCLRPAILTAYLGYALLGCGSLMVDIGRPLNFWSPVVHWQHRSVLFEIFWCILLYTGVLTVEFAPVVLERFGWKRTAHTIHRFTIPFVIGGVIFSTLHQSSLGSLYLIVPQKLMPLWYSPLLPVFFFLSAISVGLSMVVIVAALSRRFLGKGLDDAVVLSLGKFVAVVLLLFLGVRAVDGTMRGAWSAIFDHPLQGTLFLLESGALVAAAFTLLARMGNRKPGDVLAAAILVFFGVMLHRLNVAWFGLLPVLGSDYVPTWKEVSVTVMLVSVAVVLFSLAAKHLPLFEHGEGHGAAAAAGASSPADPAPAGKPEEVRAGAA